MSFPINLQPGARGPAGWLPMGLFFLTGLCWWGCSGSPAAVHRYLLDYPPPLAAAAAPLNAALTVEPFSVAQAFNSTAMVYQPRPHVSDSYRYHRWRTDPGSMITDFFLRDFRRAGLFVAILGKDNLGESRFRLEGSVEEIQEIDGPAGWVAALTLTITLLDLKDQDLTSQVLFQKTFRTQEAMTARTPAGLAQAASVAMQRLSQEIMQEVFQAARRRLQSPGKV